jgi:Polyketide cyclase / dehydrase and lipid transport
MARVEVSTSIARSPEDVFAFVADMRNEHRWHTDVLEAQLQGEGPVERGAKFWVRVKPSMGVSEGSFRVEEYLPPHVRPARRHGQDEGRRHAQCRARG